MKKKPRLVQLSTCTYMYNCRILKKGTYLQNSDFPLYVGKKCSTNQKKSNTQILFPWHKFQARILLQCNGLKPWICSKRVKKPLHCHLCQCGPLKGGRVAGGMWAGGHRAWKVKDVVLQNWLAKSIFTNNEVTYVEKMLPWLGMPSEKKYLWWCMNKYAE